MLKTRLNFVKKRQKDVLFVLFCFPIARFLFSVFFAEFSLDVMKQRIVGDSDEARGSKRKRKRVEDFKPWI